jgi:predicted AAA+ superfamily ATPase
MIERTIYKERVLAALKRSPIAAILGPRQCGKTTLARQIAEGREATYFDLESQADLRRLQNPEMMFASLSGLVVIDEIQTMPKLFAALRVAVDKPENKCQLLILGSASPEIIQQTSETLAGRVEFIDMAGFDLTELGPDRWQSLWVRGGFPRSYLAQSDADSFAWRDGFVRTFLERDIGKLGIQISPTVMRKFWTMLAHWHGQVWNASRIAAAMGINDKTTRRYLDILTETYMIRQLPPWYENLGKRQVKSPKVYFRDSGLLHHFLTLGEFHSITGHPQAGASWEGFALEQILLSVRPMQAYYWGTYQKAELDLLLVHEGRRYGVEFKFSEAPEVTRSMRIAVETLQLERLFIVYPGTSEYPVDAVISACPIGGVAKQILAR